MRSTKIALWLGVLGFLAESAGAYVDLAPTLPRLIREAEQVALVEVRKTGAEGAAIVLDKVRDLKGRWDASGLRLHAASGAVSRNVVLWAEPGQRAVLFLSSRTILLCIGPEWYEAQPVQDGWWQVAMERPELPLAYCGSVGRLAEAVPRLLAGEDVVITTMPHGANLVGATFDVVLNRARLPGFVQLQRMRANMRMSERVLAVASNPTYVIGPGAVDPQQVPELIERLSSAEPSERAEAADDLRTLGPAAGAAAEALAALLHDEAWAARLAAAAALARIAPEDQRPIAVLRDALHSDDAGLRRHGARATALAGAAAAELTDRLVTMLHDPDRIVRGMALQAIATLGPAAADAFPAVVPLLDDPELSIDAVDALGRMGAAARPAMKRLAEKLADDDPAMRWAAVRAMAQIGGDEAGPAVDFILQQLPRASERDGYNSVVYLGLLGPAARAALPALEQLRIKNRALPGLAMWAIDPENHLPWSGGSGFVMGAVRGRAQADQPQPAARGGRQGTLRPLAAAVAGAVPTPARPAAQNRGPNYQLLLFENFLNELGERLRPSATLLAKQIVEGATGNMPPWGYRLLMRFPDEALKVLTEPLDPRGDAAQRQRAISALGNMGPVAAAARPRLESLRRSVPAREVELIDWCLGQITPQ